MERDSDFLSKIQDTAQVQPRDVNAPLASHYSCAAGTQTQCHCQGCLVQYSKVFLHPWCLYESTLSPLPCFRPCFRGYPRGGGEGTNVNADTPSLFFFVNCFRFGLSVSASPCGLSRLGLQGCHDLRPFFFSFFRLWTLGTREEGPPKAK
jgi:hypothetical protein